MEATVRVGLLTREYPPEVYGGAGVHVDFLSRSLRELVELAVHCMGAPRDDATAHALRDERLGDANAALHVMAADLAMVAGISDADLLHSHTWYANLAGHLGKLLYGVPHLITAHSLEPLRPWKAEQLGGGYALSSWVERTAYEAADAIIAVSKGMRADVLSCYPDVDPDRVHVIHNGIDTELYHPVPETDVLERHGIDPSRPSIVFVGRITRQKGVPHLVRAARRVEAGTQIILLAGAPDTPELGAEVAGLVDELREQREGVVWIDEMLPREQILQFLTHATTFVCPSVYEPQGIVNLEAMACETAVVASAVGGIPEVVVDGETGVLVPYDANDLEGFERGLADAINDVVGDRERARAMGLAGRERAVEAFGWPAIAEQTLATYEQVLASRD
jgi:starch synthase